MQPPPSRCVSCSAKVAGLAALMISLAMAQAANAATTPVRGDLCNPLTYGAVADGITDDTAPIQSAIDACGSAGGGTVRLLAVNGHDRYLTGPIALASHVRLMVDKGVTLLASTDHSRYRAASRDEPYHAREALISAYDADDTGVVGPGTIDGRGGAPGADGGPSWWATPARAEPLGGATWVGAPGRAPSPRGASHPWLMEFYRCTNVTVNDITLTNAPASNLVIRHSSHITVSELRAAVTPDPAIAPVDGIDLIGSSDATLLFLHVGVVGDSVALESAASPDAPAGGASRAALPRLSTHDVRIVNSTLTGGNGIVIGREAAGGVYNVVARNIDERDARRGLVIESGSARDSRTSGVYNVMLQDLNLTGVRQPLAISVHAPAAGDGGDGEGGHEVALAGTTVAPGIRDITIAGLTATGATMPSMIVGVPGACVGNVTLRDVKIAGEGGGIRLRDMTGLFAGVTLPDADPPLVVEENVRVATSGMAPAVAATLRSAWLAAPAPRRCAEASAQQALR